jgi:hypothetical protein
MDSSLIPNFKGKRWLKISLRTIHLIGFAGVFASTMAENFDVTYWALTIFSGLSLLTLEALSNLVWFIQVRAMVIYIKFSLLFILFAFPDYAMHCLIAIIILSGFISHAPSSVRYYSIIHRKKVSSFNDIKG